MLSVLKRLSRRCALLAFIWPAAAVAAEPIDGAFGIMLGSAPDVAMLRDRADESSGEYRFQPQNPYAPLTEYAVSISPRDGVAYRIQATGRFDSAKACREELNRLTDALTRKYGVPNRDLAAREAGVSRTSFGDASRRITVTCSGLFGRQLLKLVYNDASIEHDAQHETGIAPVTTEQRDTTGL